MIEPPSGTPEAPNSNRHLSRVQRVSAYFSQKLGIPNLASNSGWILGGQAVRMSLAFFVGLWVARYLGPEKYGLLNYAIAFVALFSPFTKLGLNGLYVREMTERPQDHGTIAGSIILAQTLAGLLLIPIPLACVLWLRPGEEIVFLLVAINAVAVVLRSPQLFSLWFTANARIKAKTIVEMSAHAFVAGLNILLILNEAPVVAFAITALIQTLLFGLGITAAFQVVTRSLKTLHCSLPVILKMLKESYPLILSGAAIMIYMRVDQVMIGQMVGDKEVGIYSSAVKVIELWHFLPMMLSQMLIPVLIRANKKSNADFEAQLQRQYNFMTLVGYGIALPMTLFADPIIALLYGPNYQGAGSILMVSVWSVVFINLGLQRTSFLTVKRLLHWHPLTIVAAMITNVGLNLVLIPKYGGMGAAVATLVSQWVAAHPLCYIIKPLRVNGKMMTKALLWPKV